MAPCRADITSTLCHELCPETPLERRHTQASIATPNMLFNFGHTVALSHMQASYSRVLVVFLCIQFAQPIVSGAGVSFC